MIFTTNDFIYFSSFFVILKYSMIFFLFFHVTEISCRPIEESQKTFLDDMIFIDTKSGLPLQDNNIDKDYKVVADSSDETEFDLTEESDEFDGLVVSNFKRRRLDKWPRHNLTYRVTKYTNQLSKGVVDDQIKKAFEIWSEVTQLTFTKKLSGHVDIEIRFDKGDHGDCCPHDGRAHNVAHAFSPSDKASLGGDIHIDDDEDWTKNLDELMLVVAHEAGHSLGLRHSERRSSIMFRSYQHKTSISLDEEDISNIQKLYGLPQNKSKNKHIWHANLVNNSKHSKRPHHKQKIKHPQSRALRNRSRDENQFFSTSRFKPIHENNLILQSKPRINFIMIQYEPIFLEEISPKYNVLIPHEYSYISPYTNKSPDIVISEEDLIGKSEIQDNNIHYRTDLLFEDNSKQNAYEIPPAKVNQRTSPFGKITLEDDSIPITKIISEEDDFERSALGITSLEGSYEPDPRWQTDLEYTDARKSFSGIIFIPDERDLILRKYKVRPAETNYKLRVWDRPPSVHELFPPFDGLLNLDTNIYDININEKLTSEDLNRIYRPLHLSEEIPQLIEDIH